MTPQQKKWIYQATHRGTKESDLLLGAFVQQNIKTFSEKEMQELDILLALEDTQITNFVLKNEPPSQGVELSLLRRLQVFTLGGESLKARQDTP